MPDKVQWTPEQKDAIDARGGTLIVSAAAGSGKTAVLVERCIRRLTDTERPCSADRLLIVTFTRAATAEMRSRLTQAVTDKLVEEPENEHLQKQQMLLPSAQICTIDSFCGELVREHFEQLGLSPDFRMLDETEVTLLQQNAMEEVLEKLYEEQDPDFLRLVELLATGRDDTSIEENILRLHTYSRAYPSPEGWLKGALALYDDPAPAVGILRHSAAELLSAWDLRWTNIRRRLQEERLPEDISFADTLDCIDGYRRQLEEWNGLLAQDDLSAFAQAVEELQIPNLKKPSIPKEMKDEFFSPALELATQVKKEFTTANLRKALRAFSLTDLEDIRQDNAVLKPLAEKLVDAVLRFDTAYAAQKRNENALDFADTELFALRLLVEDPAAEPFVRTELAETLRDRFDEILIDEYQDTNKLQDTIFAAIARDDLFMVGDVKQSIYRFRQAMPELFLQKKEQYPRYDRDVDSYPATVILGKNFRSRSGVLDAVNYTFTRLLSKDVGEITYDDSEKLYFGAEDQYVEREAPDVEFHVVVPEPGSDKKRAEADHIARYIARAIAESKASGNPLRYKDFAILLRSTKNTAGVYRKALTEAGIPVYAEQGDGFQETPEVRTVLSYLSIIDNPAQDVPLLAVLLSPLCSFSEEDIAALRVAHRKGKLYPAILAEAEHDGRWASFLEDLRHFRTLSVSMGAGDLLRAFYEQTSYLSIAGAMSGGGQRRANLQQLLALADSYDANSSYGVSGFVRHMDRLAEQSGSLSTASTLSPNADVVQIMSIHKSKGLEFRVCIVADLNHKFNDSETTKRLILHPELGLGLQGRQEDTGFTYPTLIHAAMKEATLRSERSEALRVLYVAMTRARETLVLTAQDTANKNSTSDPLENSVRKTAAKLYSDDVVPSCEVLRSTTFYQWMLLALLPHPDAGLLRAKAGDATALLKTVSGPDASPIRFVLDTPDTAEEELPETAVPAPVAEESLVEEVTARMRYTYPYTALSRTRSKHSASHLSETVFSTEYFAETRPGSLSKSGMTPAERGTCLHAFMQYADLEKAAADPEEEKQRLVDQGFLLPEEADVVEPAKIQQFFTDPIAARMQKSPRLLREHKFAILVPAGRFDSALSPEEASEEVLIQGIIDCAFEENGNLVLLDYKTDRVRDGRQLADRYREQLRTYRYALEETTGLSVSEVLLYSFELGTTVPVELN